MPKNRSATDTATSGGIDEPFNVADNRRNRTNTSPTLSSTRTYSPPLMGTSARAAKHRTDSDTRPIRIDGKDIYNQQLQHHYQNVRQVLEQQNPNQIPKESKQDVFEKRLKPLTYDSPPREHPAAQKIITTITTTTKKTPTLLARPNSSLTDSPSPINHLLEHASERQKLTNVNPIKSDTQQPLIIERTEQYQVFVDPTSHEVRCTPTLPTTKITHATDLDQAQAQVNRLADDHRAIQQLTRALHEHNITANDYPHIPSPSNTILINTTTTTTTTIPPNIIFSEQTTQPIKSDFTVLDALLDNPLGTHNNQHNNRAHVRYNDILSNLRDPEYANALKQSVIKKAKKKKRNGKTEFVNKQTQITESMIESSSVFCEETPLIDSKGNKKSKAKSKKLSKTTDYEVIDAIVSSPISLRVPDSYLTKYNLSSPTSSNNNNFPLLRQMDRKAKDETVYNLVKVVNELMLHHATASTTIGKRSHQPINLNDNVYSQRPLTSSTLYENQPIKPRIVYRYLDEQGNVLKLSSTPPSQLRENLPEQSQQNLYGKTEPTYFHSRQIAINDDRHHFLPEREQRTTWLEESKLPTTITREDFEFQDKRKPKITEQSSSSIQRAVPITIEREHPLKAPPQQNVKVPWSSPSQQLDTGGYDTDSTQSEHSTTYHHYDFGPTDTHSHYNNRPLFQNQLPRRAYYPSPPPLPYNSRAISSERSGKSLSRNYIEVFRDGDTRPSEVYSLAFHEPSHHHSRFDQHQTETYRKNHSSHTSPNRDHVNFDKYLRQSKTSDYRPLHTKLQREYKITPNLLVDEWDHPQQSSSIDYNKQTSVSSPDEVFINTNRTYKAQP